MTTQRKNIYMSEAQWDVLEGIKERHQLASYGDVVSFLVNNYTESMSAMTQAQLTAEVLKESLIPFYDVLRIRTGYTDKHTKLLLALMNHLIINQGWDIPPTAHIQGIEDLPSNLYKDALRQFDESIRRYKENSKNKAIKGDVSDDEAF
ncbi:MAG: hypothetical protein Q4B80_01740 [Aerococcaceae bacterium]|nr:hypothetical protein [Aerococcaceae bacterium]